MDPETLYRYAKEVEAATGVPAWAIMTQAYHESGGFKNAPGYNYFGIKGGGAGATQRLLTTEYINGRPQKVYQNFRKYQTPKQSFEDYAALINRRYSDALKYKDDPQSFFNAVARGGYATDPNYSKLLYNVMQKQGYYKQPQATQATPQIMQPQVQKKSPLEMLLQPFSVREVKAEGLPQYPQAMQSRMPVTSGYSSATPQMSSSASRSYVVRPGDTLWGISQKLLGSGDQYKKLSGYYGDPRKLPIGTRLNY